MRRGKSSFPGLVPFKMMNDMSHAEPAALEVPACGFSRRSRLLIGGRLIFRENYLNSSGYMVLLDMGSL